ncbi:MAG: hypothetical protein R2774_03620 [Saprospiraceae bacterium]
MAGNRVYRGNECDPQCSLMVTNTNDDGIGSLRHAIECAADGDTITFDPSLSTQQILLTTGTISINKSLLIEQISTDLIEFCTSNIGPILHFASGTSTLVNAILCSSLEQDKHGRALINSAILTLNNVVIKDNSSTVGLGSSMFNSGTLTIVGDTKIIIQN